MGMKSCEIVAWWNSDGDTPIIHRKGEWAAQFTGYMDPNGHYHIQTWSNQLIYSGPRLEAAVKEWYGNLIEPYRKKITLTDPGRDSDVDFHIADMECDRLREENADLTRQLEAATKELTAYHNTISTQALAEIKKHIPLLQIGGMLGPQIPPMRIRPGLDKIILTLYGH